MNYIARGNYETSNEGDKEPLDEDSPARTIATITRLQASAEEMNHLHRRLGWVVLDRQQPHLFSRHPVHGS